MAKKTPKTRLALRDHDTPTLRFFLELEHDPNTSNNSNNKVLLMCEDNAGDTWYVAEIDENGFHLVESLPDSLGLSLDRTGAIKRVM